ncbi:MAG TPA: hypothetical protein VGK56_11435 [Anaerolineales bacterium]
MKNQPALNWLVPLIAILGAIIAGVGLLAAGGPGPSSFITIHGNTVEMYGQGLYQNDSLFAGALFRGTDAATLFVSIPLLLVSYWFYRQGSMRANIFMVGSLMYFLYLGSSYTFSVAFNSLFLIYVMLFSASLFATIVALTGFDASRLANKISADFPHRGIAIFMFVAGLGTLMLWISELIGPIMEGQAPANLGPYTTMFTHGFDSGVITPATVIAGVYILKRKPVGYLLAAPLMILCTQIGIVVITQTISQALVGIVFPVGVYIGMVGSWVVMGAFAIGLTIAFFRNLTDSEPSPEALRPVGAVS